MNVIDGEKSENELTIQHSLWTKHFLVRGTNYSNLETLLMVYNAMSKEQSDTNNKNY